MSKAKQTPKTEVCPSCWASPYHCHGFVEDCSCLCGTVSFGMLYR